MNTNENTSQCCGDQPVKAGVGSRLDERIMEPSSFKRALRRYLGIDVIYSGLRGIYERTARTADRVDWIRENQRVTGEKVLEINRRVNEGHSVFKDRLDTHVDRFEQIEGHRTGTSRIFSSRRTASIRG